MSDSDSTPLTPIEAVFSEADVELARQLAEARKNKRDWEKVEEKVKGQIRQVLGDRRSAITAGGQPVLSVKVTTRRGVDTRKLEALYPEIYEEVMKETVIEKIDLA